MFKIGYRTVKTAIGTGAAVFIAQLLGLEFYSSAGILVILCVQNTKRKSLQVSLHRFFSLVYYQWCSRFVYLKQLDIHH